MRVLFATGSPSGYMLPPRLGDAQVVCGPDWPNKTSADGRVISLHTPVGRYDLATVAARLPAEQRPDVVVCLVDASWRNMPCNLRALPCPKVLLVADTHHMNSPLIGMMGYMAGEPFDRIVFVYDRHHAAFFHAAGFRNLFWLPGLTLPHGDEFVRAARAKAPRIARIAFVGQAGKFHPRRARLIEGLAKQRLPIDGKSLSQADGLRFYGSSLIGFNASLNGDLNLRVFEILASGSALVTDQLSPQSGLGRLIEDGRDGILYGSADELCERSAHALAHPAETQAIGEAGSRLFDAHFNETRRKAAFLAVVSDGAAMPEFAFTPVEKTRVFFGGDTDRLVRSLPVYEVMQELHRTADTVRVAVGSGAHPDIGEICSTLPRIECVPAAGAGPSDIAVVGKAEASVGANEKAPLLWCCDAGATEVAGIAASLGPLGYAPLSGNLALFRRTSSNGAEPNASSASRQLSAAAI